MKGLTATDVLLKEVYDKPLLKLSFKIIEPKLNKINKSYHRKTSSPAEFNFNHNMEGYHEQIHRTTGIVKQL